MRILITLCLLLIANSSLAQWNWPVQTNVTTVPPYYNYLSYYADQNDHLQIMVTLTDQNASAVPAKLKIRIEGAGWWVETKPFNNIPPLYLDAFVPNIISGIQLQPYLQASNLNKSNPQLDLNNLPEGFTNVCVEVIGVGGTLTVIGGNQCTPFWLQLFQPPQAFLPVCESVVDTNAMFHLFQWSPPIGYLPTISSELSYTFSLYEWVDPTNYTIFETGQGLIYQTTTNQNTIQLSDFDVQMQQGMHYVWRVQAHLTDNGMPVNMFENNGLSEICTFQYGESVSIAEQLAAGLFIDLDAEASTEYKGFAHWTVVDNTPGVGLSNYDRFFIEYRLKPDATHPNPTWQYDTVYSINHFMYQLGAERTYQVRVSGIAGNFQSDATAIVEFTTPAAIDYACGDQQQPYKSPNYTPNDHVTAGNQVQIGQFMMTVSEVIPQGSIGYYSGKGTIPIDFLGGARAKVRFDNILIDNEYVVRQGRVDVITDGLDNWLNEQYMQFIEPIYVNGTVDSAWVDTTAGVAWVVVDGVSLEFVFDPPDYPIIINDESGYQWTIYPNGVITVTSFLDLSNDHLDVTAANAGHFQQNDTETFGFDGKQHIQWHENYEIILLSDSSHYFVPNKSVGQNETDVVDFLAPNGVSPTFKLDDANTISAASTGNLFTVNIPSIPQSGEHTIYAYNGTDRIGKVNVHVYASKEREIVFVPLTNATIDETQLTAALQRTLGEANLELSLTIENQWNDTLFTSSKTIELPEDITLMSKYSQDMRDLRDAYFSANPNATKEAYYIFVVPSFNDANADGYMVRGKSLGFVKAGSNYLTYAHELAHGMGALEHSWKNNGPAEGSTDNLMDYSVGAENFTKAQWKELRDWDVAPSMFDGIEDGSFASEMNLYYTLEKIIELPYSNAIVTGFYTPSGNFIKPTNGSLQSWFFDNFSGAVSSFRLTNGDIYDGLYSKNPSRFIGYFKRTDISIEDFIRDSLNATTTTDEAYVDWFIENGYATTGFVDAYFTQFPQLIWTEYSEVALGDIVTAAIRESGTCDIFAKSFAATQAMIKGIDPSALQQLKNSPSSVDELVNSFIYYTELKINPIRGEITPITTNSYPGTNFNSYNLVNAGALMSLEEIEDLISKGINPVNQVICGLLENFEQNGKFPYLLTQTSAPTKQSLENLWNESPSKFLYLLYASDVIETHGWEVFNEFMDEHNDELQQTLSNFFIGRGNQQFATTQDLQDELNSAKNLYHELKNKIDQAQNRFDELKDAFTNGGWDDKVAMTFAFTEGMTRLEIETFLPLNIRYRMIRVLCSVNLYQNYFFDMEESTATKLFLAIADNQIVNYVEGLVTESMTYDGQDVKLFYAMMDNLNGTWDFFDGQYQKFSTKFIDILKTYYEKKGSQNLNFSNPSQPILSYSGFEFILPGDAQSSYTNQMPPYSSGDQLLSAAWDGDLTVNVNLKLVQSTQLVANGQEQFNVNYTYTDHWDAIHPFTFVGLDFENSENISILNSNASQNAQFVPAYMLKYFTDQTEDANTLRSIEIGLTIATMPFGMVGGMAALNSGRYLLAFAEFADVTVDVISISSNDPDLQAAVGAYSAIRLPFQIGATIGNVRNMSHNGNVIRPHQDNIDAFLEHYDDIQNAPNVPLSEKKKAEKLKTYLNQTNVVNGVGTWLDALEPILGSGSVAKIQGWIDEGLNATKLENAFANASDVSDLFDDLDGAKSVFHQRTLINDRVDQIPGVSASPSSNNGLPRMEVNAPNGMGTEFNLPADEAANFTNVIFEHLSAGTKIYRVIGKGAYNTGGYWTVFPPQSYADIIGGTAVRPSWNGMEQIIEYTVPQGGIYIWKGGTAKKTLVSEIDPNYSSYQNFILSGGGQQIYMPNIYRDYTNPQTLSNFNTQITQITEITWQKN